MGYDPGWEISSGSTQVSCCGELQLLSSTSPSQSSSLSLSQTSGKRLLTAGSSSSQSWPRGQCPSGSPSPSASRGWWVQVCVASTQASMVHGVVSLQETGSPALQPTFGTQRSSPSQYTPFWQGVGSGVKRQSMI